MAQAGTGNMLGEKKNIYGIMMIVNLIFFAAMHATFVGFTNDDSYFVILRSEYNSLIDLLVFRYQTDSSRVLSEAILFTLIKCPFIIWQIFDVGICVLIYHCLATLFVDDKYSMDNVWVFMAFASYPFMHVGSAGWICTTLNYLWPLATLLYALVVAKRRSKGLEIGVVRYILAFVCIIFTANCEMPATVLVMVFALVLLYGIREKRSIWYEISAVVIGIAGVVFALSAPGNDERTAMEAANWMPEFFDLSIFEKARLCSVFVFEHYVAIPDVIFFLFALVLVFAGVRKKNKWWENGIAILPLGIDVLFTGYYFVKDFILGHKTTYDYSYPAIYMTDSATKFLQLSEVAGLVLFILASIYTLCLVLARAEKFNDGVSENTQEISAEKATNKKTSVTTSQVRADFWKKNYDAIWSIWMLATGFAVRMALMLSPTMFSSWHRTLIFMYFAFLYSALLVMKKCRLMEKKWMRIIIIGVLVIGIIVNLILTVGLQIRKAGGYY